MVLLVRQLRRTSAPYKSTHRHPLHRVKRKTKKKERNKQTKKPRTTGSRGKTRDYKSRNNDVGPSRRYDDEFLIVISTILLPRSIFAPSYRTDGKHRGVSADQSKIGDSVFV